jgi:NAD(P)-dependent dehydrogenase (short-subunit alcohol dehydrogenase family)
MTVKNYLVVGGSSGIGFQIVQDLLNESHKIWMLSRSQPLTEDSENFTWLKFDVLADDPSELELPEKLDGLVYCPGSINLRPFRGLKEEDFQNDMEINFLGAVKVIKSVLKPLQQSGNGSIVLFSTVAVGQGMPFHSSIAAAKGAVEGFSRSLAAELAPKVRVNCIAPSLTDTPLAQKLLSTPQKEEASAQRHPLKRTGEPSDMAAVAKFLLGDKAGWITGQVIAVDGGLSTLRV